MVVTCNQCGDEFDYIGNHWRLSSCEYPTVTEHQKEVVKGLMMGDGCLDRCSKNPRLSVTSISQNYLKYLNDVFGNLSCGYSVAKTPEESAKISADSGFSDGNVENHSTIYKWTSRTLPCLKEFDWYTGEDGKKVWPEDLSLTPTTLKHWFCGDGTWNNNGYRSYLSIAMNNERGNTEKVSKYFERVGLPTPSNYAKVEDGCIAQFTQPDSKELWQYMGEPLPDFEYKWPERFQ